MSDPYRIEGNKKYVRRSVISFGAQGPFYHDTDGSRRSIGEGQLLYDRKQNEWGYYMRGGQWVVAKPPTQDPGARTSGGGGESSSRQGKHARKESTDPGVGSRSKRGRGGR